MIAAHPEAQPRFAVLPPRSAAVAAGAKQTAGTAATTQTAVAAAAIQPTESAGDELKPFGEDGFSFLDILDIINPLQHLPVIGTLYREWTGDTLAPAPRIAGDILFGGPIGAFFGIANVITESATGKDMGQHALAWLRGTDDPGKTAPPATQLAKAATGTPAPASAIVATPSPIPAVAAFQVAPAAAQPTAGADSALATAVALSENAGEFSENVGIIEPRRVIFAPPTRSRIPLPPTQPQGTSATAATTTAPAVPAAPQRPPVTSLLGRPPLFAVMPPPPASLSGAGSGAATAAIPSAPDSTPAAGSAALDGGWFSETMLSALRKYEKDVTRRPLAATSASPVGASY